VNLTDFTSWEGIAAVVSAVIGLLTVGGAVFRWREQSLRREDVQDWANEAIAALQTLVLLAGMPPGRIPADEAARRLTEVIFATSILVERGRLFFRNKPWGDYGTKKPRAYRGRRPALLDDLIAAHQAALRLEGADARTRAQLSLIAEDALKDFVTRMQHEVGRSRTASPATGKAGESVDVAVAASRLDPRRVADRMAEMGD
jgi:hypothetical protein